jgi:hypothetical protein
MRSTPYAVLTAVFAASDVASTLFLDEVRAAAAYLRKHHGYSMTSFSACTGLHKNSLIRLMDERR